MKPFGIKNLHVESFRAMKDVDIPIGQRLTAIAGQNSTGKSTILGMLGQPFGMTGYKTILDKSFRTKFSDIFNFPPITTFREATAIASTSETCRFAEKSRYP